MDCPEGYTLRKGYTRKFNPNVKRNGYTVRRKGVVYMVHPTANSVKVDSACVKKRTKKKSIGKLRKGDLIKYGYQYRLSDAKRQIALKRAIKQYGAVSLYRKLDAVAKLSVRIAPDASKTFGKDRDWVREKYIKS